jgi:hypothetical protein
MGRKWRLSFASTNSHGETAKKEIDVFMRKDKNKVALLEEESEKIRDPDGTRTHSLYQSGVFQSNSKRNLAGK